MRGKMTTSLMFCDIQLAKSRGGTVVSEPRAAFINRRRWLLGAAAGGGLFLTGLQNLARGDEPPSGFIASTLNYVRLPDARRLAYSEYGDPRATTIVIYHHGIPSCRLDGETFRQALCCRPGVRLYVIDRPGIGCSDPYCCKTFLTWPADLQCFVDTLKIGKFAVMGASGGTPYALAVARAMPERVTTVSIACPMAPLEAVGSKTGSGAMGARLAVQHPLLSRAVLTRFATAERRRPNRMPMMARFASAPDRNLLLDPAERRYLAYIVDEAFRQGAAQVSHEAALLTQPWDGWLPEVRTRVNILTGCQDRIAPPVMARYLAARLPNATLTLFPDEAHISLGRRRAGEMLDAAIVRSPDVAASR